MRYRVSHVTEYRYSEPVSLCHNEAHLLLSSIGGQRCDDSRLRVEPAPALLDERADYFGNRTSYFELHTPHRRLRVRALSRVDTAPPPPLPDAPPWERLRDRGAASTDPDALTARELSLPSPLLPQAALAACADYARASFTPGRPLLAAAAELNRRIHDDFDYDPQFSTVATPLAAVLEHRRGVCQDFAHLYIACLRALELPARYVSGYLETLPPPGQTKLQGSDASHAWAGVYVPGHGWFDFDPTNRKRPDEQYVLTAWGRDYADVTPLRGVAFGGGETTLKVAVDVERLD